MRKSIVALFSLFVFACATSPPPKKENLKAAYRNKVEAAILSHRNELGACYEKRTDKSPANSRGYFVTDIIVGADGAVQKDSVIKTTLKSPSTENCVLTIIKTIQFPARERGKLYEIKYPFKFKDPAS